ncbi:MAG: tRNA lysidine(34) synthetase TilS [Acidobacteriota bacterium]
MPLLASVRQYAERHHLWRQDTRVVAAVSGGSDSVALLCLLHEFHVEGTLILDAVAHLHHGIRGEAADHDAAFCAALAETLGHPFVSARIDVPARARRERVSLALAARAVRREFLEDTRRARAADRMATAHTADDQAETVLLRLMRGTGLRGLGGIAPLAGDWIRPVLGCTRDDLRAELVCRGQRWCEDATNDDLKQPRSRVRLELIPYLQRHFNPGVKHALCRLADLARADEALISQDVAAAAERVLHLDDGLVRVHASRLSALPAAVAQRLVRCALAALADDLPADWALGEAVREAIARRSQLSFAGVRVEHSGDFAVLVLDSPPPPAVAFDVVLPVPGAVQLPEAGWRLEASEPEPPGGTGAEASPDTAMVDALSVGSTLRIRSRQPGDRIRPLGMAGSKKVQDVFVDRKVSRLDRDRTPLVTAADGRIIWVAGHVLGEDFKVTERTNSVVILRLRRFAAS